jgi:hypothetical protein
LRADGEGLWSEDGAVKRRAVEAGRLNIFSYLQREWAWRGAGAQTDLCALTVQEGEDEVEAYKRLCRQRFRSFGFGFGFGVSSSDLPTDLGDMVVEAGE